MSYCSISSTIIPLTDLRDIEIDTKAPVEKKLASFARQTKKPYVNRIRDYVVKVCYQGEEPAIDEKMEEYIRRLAEIQEYYRAGDWFMFDTNLEAVEASVKAYYLAGKISKEDLNSIFKKYGIA